METNVVEDSIALHTRSSDLSRRIRGHLGSYVTRKQYLAKPELIRKLQLMGYCTTYATDLADYCRECVESAYERGIFVVSSRVVKLKDIPSTSQDIVSVLAKPEPAYFDPFTWYRLIDFQRELKSMKYSSLIIAELAPYFLRHVRAGFTRGINSAANPSLIKQFLH